MRTLLFRGQGTDKKDWHTWYEGAYVRMDDTTYCFSEDYACAAAEGKVRVTFISLLTAPATGAYQTPIIRLIFDRKPFVSIPANMM